MIRKAKPFTHTLRQTMLKSSNIGSKKISVKNKSHFTLCPYSQLLQVFVFRKTSQMAVNAKLRNVSVKDLDQLVKECQMFV